MSLIYTSALSKGISLSLLGPQPAQERPVPCALPLFSSRIPAGFPSPAEGYVEQGLDLNAFMVRNRASTFYFRVQGNSMTGARIFDGDLLVVDRSIEPKHGHIVLAVVNEEYTVKRLYRRAGTIELRAENTAYPPIRFREDEELRIWGVVTGTICRFNM